MTLGSFKKVHQIFADYPVITNDDGTQFVVTEGTEYKLPDHITLHQFHTSHGVPIRFYTAKAENETSMIMGASGFKTDFIMTPKEISALNSQGVSVCWLALPNPERNAGFMDCIMEAAKEVLVEPRHAEIRAWCARDVPKIFFGHSTGAQLFLRLAVEGHHRRLNRLFSGAVLSSPYITPPGTEHHLTPSSIAFNFYAWKHALKLPSETPLGQAYLKRSERANFEGPDLAKYQVPIYAQIQELREGGAIVLDALRDPNSAIHRLKMPFMVAAGENDKFSSPRISSEVAKTFQGAFYYARGLEHSPLSNNINGFGLLLGATKAMANQELDAFSQQYGLKDYTVNSERFIVTKLAYSALIQTAIAAKQQLSLARLRPHMPSLFSRTP